MDAQNNLNDVGGGALSNTVRGFDNRYEGLKGSPYLFDLWRDGEVTIGNQKAKRKMKYDAYRDELVLLGNNSRDSILADKSKVTFFQLEATTDLPATKFIALRNDKGVSTFYEMLLEGKTSLLLNHKKPLRKADYKGAYSVNRTQDEFLYESSFWLMDSNGDLTRLRQTAKALPKSFPDRHDELSAFIKSEAIDPKNTEDLLKLVAFYNEK
jgi:hypothetical protein